MSDQSKKIKVLMVGTDESTKGGMWTVANNYIKSATYNESVDLKYIPTFVVGSFIKKIAFTFIAYIKIFFEFIFHTPKLLHVHMSERGSVYRKGIIINMAKIFKAKVIIHMHGAEFQDWYDSLNEHKKKRVRMILNKSDKVLILGKYWKEFVVSLVPEDKVLVLYNAVPHHENIYDSDGSTLMFLGVVGQRKGAYDLVKAFSEVINDIPDRIRLVFYGPDFEHKIESVINDSGHNDRIFYNGWLDSKQKEIVFADTICSILPSYNEGLPMTILETMAAGIPNISTNVAAIPEVVTNENGFVISPGDIGALKEALKSICNDEKKRADMSKNAYKTIEYSFTIEKNIENILKIYWSVLL